MVTFRIISTGKPPKDWRSEAFQHYSKLISPFANLEEFFVKEQKVTESSNIELAMKREAESLLKALSTSSHVIALDKSGSTYSSVELSRHLETHFQRHSKFDFVIGGPHGLDGSVADASHEVMSLSSLTFPHDLARIMLAEQLYRVMSILNKLPYHK